MIPSLTTQPIGWIGDTMKKERAIKMIRAERNRKGMSSFIAAEKADINQSTWSRTESGDRATSWDVLIRMAKAVGLNASITIRKKQ